MTAVMKRRLQSLGWLSAGIIALSILLICTQLLRPSTQAGTDRAKTPYTPLIESLVGSDHVRIGDAGQGNIVVLLNATRPKTSSTENTAQSITGFIEAMAPGRPVIVREVPFAESGGAWGSPYQALEIATLLAITLLAGWILAKTRTHNEPERQNTPLPANDSVPPGLEPVTARPNTASSTEKAARFAERRPAQTAEIISRWLKDEDL